MDSNTTTLGDCPLKLRTCNGQLVGPTLRASQGDAINLMLKKQAVQRKKHPMKSGVIRAEKSECLS
ncbi:hypothetical protein SAMN05216302_100374 [Nitrosomonas aestuarii]|uniref:Uncharacterized protein n=1 Tax=Nitrosomonas aestuarii TaxID=52441 RepID=A0A1I3Y883_9PROT|nr:hypothetical protein [Nitrosomonas aestuarii]SFK27982.1 hypothetical protein SAMN05216302_100374 [Nitrosomonas aestuarii]|tara:strand:- start:16 stop:213 length:198 start_codon:yes stop_codon:yes gene_type:complete